MANRFWEKFNQGLETGNKIWEADAKRRMQADIAAANKMSPEMQSVGLQAPQAGQVPTGYEEYIQARPEGGFAPVVGEGIAPEQLEQRRVIAERFSAPTAFQGVRNSYTLGDTSRETEFTPDDVAQARMQRKAQIYSDYGREDLAEQMQTNALARKASSLQIQKMQADVDDQAAFRKDLAKASELARSAVGVASQAQQLIEAGDKEGAARLILDWRSNNVPDKKMMRLNDSGIIEGSADGGKTWMVAKGTAGNVYNPQVVENLLGEIKNSADEHISRLMFTHVKTPEALSQMINASKELALKEAALQQNENQFTRTFGLESRKADNDRDYKQGVLGVSRDELRLKEKELPSKIAENYRRANSSGATTSYYNALAGEKNMSTGLAKQFQEERGKVIQDLEDNKITPLEADRQLNRLGMKYGGQIKELKQMTAKDYNELVMGLQNTNPNFDKLEKPVQDKLISEEWQRIQALSGNGVPPQPFPYVDIAKSEKATKGLMPSGVPR